MDNIIDSTINIGLVFFILLVSAVIIERFLQFMSIAINFLEPFVKLDKLWWHTSVRIQEKLKRGLLKAQSSGRKEMQLVINAVKSTVFKANPAAGEPVIIQVALVRRVMLAIILQLIGISIGILIAFKTNMDVFALVNELDVTHLYVNPFWAKLLTGILIGSGTSPVHSVINYIEKRKENQKQQVEVEKLREGLGK
jgi:hypothetical protein